MHHLAVWGWGDVENLGAESFLVKLEGAAGIANRQMRCDGVESIGYRFNFVSHENILR
jgi:hypothetical protein